MQIPINKTIKMLLKTEDELFDLIVDQNHPFRKLKEIIKFEDLVKPMLSTYSTLGTNAIPIENGLKTLLIQFWEDYSDRQMEKAIRENMAVRWFCGFSLTEQTPDHSYFSKLRKRIGTKRIANFFEDVNKTLSDYRLFGNVFTFIDASTIITKTALWEERDSAIADGAKKLNNTNIEKYAEDKDARWGAKSKNNIWFGHKRHVAVDMRHGLIKKIAITNASVPDFKAVAKIIPKQGMVFMDKIYDTKKTNTIVQSNNCFIGTIKKNNNKEKNRDIDKFHSKLRMPFESTFSRLNRRARYRGHVKVTMQAFLQAICYNLKKAVRLIDTNLIKNDFSTSLVV